VRYDGFLLLYVGDSNKSYLPDSCKVRSGPGVVGCQGTEDRKVKKLRGWEAEKLLPEHGGCNTKVDAKPQG
jgi:hypothetical protein